MSLSRWFFVAVVALAAVTARAEDKPKRLLLVTHSGGFIHDSVGVAEEVVKEMGGKHAYEVTCFRFTGDPSEKVKYKPEKDKPEVEVTALEKYSAEFRKRTGKTVEAENCGRLNKETLAKFDIVFFYTTGNPTTKEELADLTEWVKAGGALAGTHSASDTLYKTTYGDLIGGYFVNHPWHQKVKLKVEDPKHPAAAGFEDGAEITDEIYQFADVPYSRDKLHIILSIDNSSIDVKKGQRKDQDYAVAWGHEVGTGKVFYTSLGHRKEVWKDERFQKHLLGGLNWATGRAPGSAAPSGKK